MSAYFIVDPFNSSHESFDFWIKWIQEGAVCFLSTFGPQLGSSLREQIIKWQTQWQVICIYIKSRRKNKRVNIIEQNKHIKIFKRAIYSKFANLENKAISSSIYNWIVVFVASAFMFFIIQIFPTMEINKILIIRFHSFLNRSINIIMDCCYNRNQQLHGLSSDDQN